MYNIIYNKGPNM